MQSRKAVAHHIKSIPPVLRKMAELGFDEASCLEGTGLTAADLREDTDVAFTQEQEYRFNRRLLELTGNPLLGLEIGGAFPITSYGLFGYAFLSAATLRHAMMVIKNYGLLTFTPFLVDFQTRGRVAAIRFSPRSPIPADLHRFYADRDAMATIYGGESALEQKLPLQGVSLEHSHSECRQDYEAHFGCPVDFGAPYTEVRFNADMLDTPMPQRDADTSGVCQQQCQLLMARLSKESGFVDEVRQLIIGRPGYFPDIEVVAERLNTSVRTLRRKLAAEGSSYQDILNEVRYNLARDYLANSTLPIEEISNLLGYSTPGNFSYAFKRWHGTSPRAFRSSQ